MSISPCHRSRYARMLFSLLGLTFAGASVAVVGCKKDESTTTAHIKSKPVVQPAIGLQKRMGDEIVVAGHLYRIGTPVVTWMDEGGFDAYRTERRFSKFEESSYEATTQAMAKAKAAKERYVPDIEGPARYNMRYAPTTSPASSFAVPSTQPLTPAQVELVRGGGWPLELLQQKVDQFVVHYDVAGTSANCFSVLHDNRGLSVHFMLDLDGTIYQTLDLKERAWQATKANTRSIGIEIANMGSYSLKDTGASLDGWYKKDAEGKTYIQIPARLGGMNSQRTKPTILRPARNEPVVGPIRGVNQKQYDLTPQQYDALIKLVAGLSDVFPLIKCDVPRDTQGKVLWRTLTDEEYNKYQGVLGHYHVQTNKSDPGPAFQWDYVISEAQKELAARRKTTVAAK